MNWIGLLWPMATAAFLTMALVHLLTGLRKPEGRVNVLFAVSASYPGSSSQPVEWVRSTLLAQKRFNSIPTP